MSGSGNIPVQNALFYIKIIAQNALFYIKPRVRNAIFRGFRRFGARYSARFTDWYKAWASFTRVSSGVWRGVSA